jgi:hypothetical protein
MGEASTRGEAHACALARLDDLPLPVELGGIKVCMYHNKRHNYTQLYILTTLTTPIYYILYTIHYTLYTIHYTIGAKVGDGGFAYRF